MKIIIKNSKFTIKKTSKCVKMFNLFKKYTLCFKKYSKNKLKYFIRMFKKNLKLKVNKRKLNNKIEYLISLNDKSS